MTTIYPFHRAARELGRRRHLQFSGHRGGYSERSGRKAFEGQSCIDIPRRRPNQRLKRWRQLLEIASQTGWRRRWLAVAAGLGYCEVGDVGRAEFEAEHRQGSGSRIGKNFGQEDFSKILDFDEVML